MAKTMVPTINFVSSKLKMKRRLIRIDNTAFWLHYRCTALFLAGVTVIVCGSQYFDTHIQCMADKGVPIKVINTYCFTMGTFTVYKHHVINSSSAAHPGVGSHGIDDDSKVLYHAYYQWIPYVIFFQAVMCYVPHVLWKHLEDGRVKNLVEGLEFSELAFSKKDIKTKSGTIPSEDNLDNKVHAVKKSFIQRLQVNSYWGLYLTLCEIVNLVNLIAQIHLTHILLGGKFWNFGPKVFETDYRYLEEVFPKVAKCTFHKYGPSGSIQNHDALCVLNLNVLYEKVYLILWFWFGFVGFTTIISLIYRIISVFLYRRSSRFNRLTYKLSNITIRNISSLMNIITNCNYSNWLFLYYLGKNMNERIFLRLLDSIAEEMDANDAEVNSDKSDDEHSLLD